MNIFEILYDIYILHFTINYVHLLQGVCTCHVLYSNLHPWWYNLNYLYIIYFTFYNKLRTTRVHLLPEGVYMSCTVTFIHGGITVLVFLYILFTPPSAFRFFYSFFVCLFA